LKKSVLLFCILLFFIMVGCGEKKEELYVYNWGEYIDTEVLSQFEEENDCVVIYQTYNTNEDMYLKLKKSGEKYDVIFPSDYMIEKMVNEDMLHEIDIEKLENYKHVNSAFKNFDFDQNNKFGIPYMWGTIGILYNSEVVDEDIGSWDMLWNEKYKDRILMFDSVRDTFACALKKLGYSLNTENESEIEEAKQLLIEQRDLVKGYVVDQVKTMMPNGDADIAAIWSGEAILLMEANPKLKFFVPESGSNIWFDNMSIPKTSENVELAQKFIDFMCKPEIALKNAEYIGYATANSSAQELLSDEIKNNPLYYPNQKIIDKCEVFKDLGETIKLYDKAWVEVKVSK